MGINFHIPRAKLTYRVFVHMLYALINVGVNNLELERVQRSENNMASRQFSFCSMVRGYHVHVVMYVYEDIWDAIIGEELVYKRDQ